MCCRECLLIHKYLGSLAVDGLPDTKQKPGHLFDVCPLRNKHVSCVIYVVPLCPSLHGLA